jgi:hypothetical protein
MKKNIEKFADFEIEWKSVLRIGPQAEGLKFLFGEDYKNVIGFIDGWGWSRKETNHVKVLVLSPGSKEWGSLLPDPKKILEEVKECVRIVLKDPDGKLCGEIKNNIQTSANA